ncbi:MAG: type II secretion system minor pseudopilin GspJ, partial [Aeromonas sp.]
MSTRTPAAGFTLLEMLVAIAVFAMLSVMSQQVVSGVMQADSISEQQHSELQALQQMMQYLTHDLTQMIPKTVRSGPAGREAA